MLTKKLQSNQNKPVLLQDYVEAQMNVSASRATFYLSRHIKKLSHSTGTIQST